MNKRVVDKKLISKIGHKEKKNSLLHNCITINSNNEFISYNFLNDTLIFNIEESALKVYGFNILSSNTHKIYYIPLEICTQCIFDKSNTIVAFDIKRLYHLIFTSIQECNCWDITLAFNLLNENFNIINISNAYTHYIHGSTTISILQLNELYHFQKQVFQKNTLQDVFKVFRKIETPCIRVLYSMEKIGIKTINQDTRVHCHMAQYGSKTGRIYTSSPNLQAYGKSKLCSDEGLVLLSADFSQYEIRIAAELSQDKNLLSLLHNNIDVYSYVASKIYHKKYEDCLKQNNQELRNRAKTILLSYMYGVSNATLIKELNASENDVNDIIQQLKKLFPELITYQQQCITDVKTNKYVTTLFGRKRRFIDDVTPKLYRQIINAPIQGTGADILKLVLILLSKSKQLQELNVRLLLPIHDEIIFECPLDVQEDAKKEIKNIMEFGLKKYLQVPLQCDIITL